MCTGLNIATNVAHLTCCSSRCCLLVAVARTTLHRPSLAPSYPLPRHSLSPHPTHKPLYKTDDPQLLHLPTIFFPPPNGSKDCLRQSRLARLPPLPSRPPARPPPAHLHTYPPPACRGHTPLTANPAAAFTVPPHTFAALFVSLTLAANLRHAGNLAKDFDDPCTE